MGFNINDKVVCIKTHDQEWFCSKTKATLIGPEPDEILVIDAIYPNGYLVFNKYNNPDKNWTPLGFRKLDYKFAEEVMKSIIEQPIEITQL